MKTKKPLTQKAVRALRKSIKHWERMRKADPNEARECPNANDCDLCNKFRKLHELNGGHFCDGCPVKAKTGLDSCLGTPFAKAADAFGNFRSGYGSRLNWKRLATKEIRFLKSLLPKSK